MNKPLDPRKLASLLRQLRKRHKISLNQLARATGISRRTPARIETGRWLALSKVEGSPVYRSGRFDDRWAFSA